MDKPTPLVRSPAFRRPASAASNQPAPGDPADSPSTMYRWRRWTGAEREQAMSERRLYGYPRHSPPHLEEPGRFRIVTGTCHEHAYFLSAPSRLAWFENELLEHLMEGEAPCAAWVVLPNHYHILVRIDNMKEFSQYQGLLHGRTSFTWNGEDRERGRQIWYRCQDRVMRSEAHYFTTLNYIHNNPVKHGYVEKWGDWPYSSFQWYLEKKGRPWLRNLWREYPVLNYGANWDV